MLILDNFFFTRWGMSQNKVKLVTTAGGVGLGGGGVEGVNKKLDESYI